MTRLTLTKSDEKNFLLMDDDSDFNGNFASLLEWSDMGYDIDNHNLVECEWCPIEMQMIPV